MTQHNPFEEFEKLGEATVRDKVASTEWLGVQAARARTWLEMQEKNKPKPWHENWHGKLILDAIRYIAAAISGYLISSFQNGSWPFD